MTPYATPAMLHTIPVRNWAVRQWLQSMGLKFGYNYLVAFMDEVPEKPVTEADLKYYSDGSIPTLKGGQSQSFWAGTSIPISTKMTEQQLNRLLGDLLNQVVCTCGGSKHHGIQWMPEGSGEGLSVAVELLRKAGL